MIASKTSQMTASKWQRGVFGYVSHCQSSLRPIRLIALTLPLKSHHHRCLSSVSFRNNDPCPIQPISRLFQEHVRTISTTNQEPAHPESLKGIVRSFYDDIWNKFDLGPVDDLISPNVKFRGTLEDTTQDKEGFKRYVLEIQASFPDFYQRIDELFVCVDGQTCIAKMWWSAVRSLSVTVQVDDRYRVSSYTF
jgi:hypothetical protein